MEFVAEAWEPLVRWCLLEGIMAAGLAKQSLQHGGPLNISLCLANLFDGRYATQPQTNQPKQVPMTPQECMMYGCPIGTTWYVVAHLNIQKLFLFFALTPCEFCWRLQNAVLWNKISVQITCRAKYLQLPSLPSISLPSC